MFRFLPVALMFLAFRPALALSADTPKAREITVMGDAAIKVPPNEVAITLGVETRDKDLRIAKRANDQRMKSVLAAAKDNGVEARNIQTDYVGIEPEYERPEHQQPILLGYVVRRTVVLTLRDIPKFDDLLAAVLESGANYVQGIDFRTTELRKYRDQARALAIRAARDKATALANELGQTVGKPQSIREDSSQWWSPYGSYNWGSGRYREAASQNVVQASNRDDSSGAVTTAGQISVTSKMFVVFAFDNK